MSLSQYYGPSYYLHENQYLDPIAPSVWEGEPVSFRQTTWTDAICDPDYGFMARQIETIKENKEWAKRRKIEAEKQAEIKRNKTAVFKFVEPEPTSVPTIKGDDPRISIASSIWNLIIDYKLITKGLHHYEFPKVKIQEIQSEIDSILLNCPDRPYVLKILKEWEGKK